MMQLTSRQERTVELRSILKDVGDSWPIVPRLLRTELHTEHDVHAYYYFTGVGKCVLHIQAYPGMSTDTEAVTTARMMDGDRLAMARARGVRIGNEHEAVIGTVYEQTKTGYHTDEIIGLVGKNLRRWNIP